MSKWHFEMHWVFPKPGAFGIIDSKRGFMIWYIWLTSVTAILAICR